MNSRELRVKLQQIRGGDTGGAAGTKKAPVFTFNYNDNGKGGNASATAVSSATATATAGASHADASPSSGAARNGKAFQGSSANINRPPPAAGAVSWLRPPAASAAELRNREQQLFDLIV